jgi:carboxypeptidase D
MKFILIFLILYLISKAEPTVVDFNYHNHVQLTSVLNQLADLYPSKIHKYSIGQSVEGRDLWVVAIADSNPSVHIPLRPEAKYIGNMHGNEVREQVVLFCWFIVY